MFGTINMSEISSGFDNVGIIFYLVKIKYKNVNLKTKLNTNTISIIML